MEKEVRMIYLWAIAGILLYVGNQFVIGFFERGSYALWMSQNGAHFLGGLIAFFFWLWLFRYLKKPEFSVLLLLAVLGAVATGVAWEWYEFGLYRAGVIAGETYVSLYTDTNIDLLLVSVGALLGAGIAWAKNKLAS